MLNKAILMGRLTRDPELRYTQNNLPFASFSIAIDRGTSKNTGEKLTDFIPVIAWRSTAEFVSKWFIKGMMIIVTGSIQSRNWQDKNGNNRTSIEVVADEVQFGESKKSRESNAGYQDSGYQKGGRSGYNQQGYSQQRNPSYPPNVAADDYTEISDDDGEVPF